MLPVAPEREAEKDSVHLAGCSWPSEHGEFFELSAEVDDLMPGDPSLAILVVDAQGKASAVRVVDDQVHGAVLSRGHEPPEQDVTPAGLTWNVSELNTASIESSTVTALGRTFVSALGRARPSTTQVEHRMFDGASYQFRVSGWLCAESTIPPAGTEAWRLARIHAALAAHSRLAGEAEIRSSNEALRALTAAPLEGAGQDLDQSDD